MGTSTHPYIYTPRNPITKVRIFYSSACAIVFYIIKKAISANQDIILNGYNKQERKVSKI
jgi:hypothetical protein